MTNKILIWAAISAGTQGLASIRKENLNADYKFPLYRVALFNGTSPPMSRNTNGDNSPSVDVASWAALGGASEGGGYACIRQGRFYFPAANVKH